VLIIAEPENNAARVKAVIDLRIDFSPLLSSLKQLQRPCQLFYILIPLFLLGILSF